MWIGDNKLKLKTKKLKIDLFKNILQQIVFLLYSFSVKSATLIESIRRLINIKSRKVSILLAKILLAKDERLGALTIWQPVL